MACEAERHGVNEMNKATSIRSAELRAREEFWSDEEASYSEIKSYMISEVAEIPKVEPAE